ncbi:YbaB/EbfC family nucleoid-associated protein [Phytomonospora sp. NPDC050363]|uniref:YbaB/EbfC family nucleoid-associated protein n=1 Tax=Phytomonospora sp. NPDC050363 TaxID=3155642 RepID=UPI0034086228
MTEPDGRRLQAQAEQLRGLIEAASVESVSDDHAVRVTVGPGGAVLDVEVTTRALGRSGDEIGELVVAEVKKAERRLNMELNEKMAELLGAEGAARVGGGLDGSGMPTLAEVRSEREALRVEREGMEREQER